MKNAAAELVFNLSSQVVLRHQPGSVIVAFITLYSCASVAKNILQIYLRCAHLADEIKSKERPYVAQSPETATQTER